MKVCIWQNIILSNYPFFQIILVHSALKPHVIVSYKRSSLQDWLPRISNPIPQETCEEEQMSLSTEIKNHYFDSFTNSFVSSAVEDEWQDDVNVLIWSLIFTGKYGASYRVVVTCRQLPITYVSVTLHAAVNMSLVVITREREVVILLEASYILYVTHKILNP